jgi:hypothetical protein
MLTPWALVYLSSSFALTPSSAKASAVAKRLWRDRTAGRPALSRGREGESSAVLIVFGRLNAHSSDER